MYPGTHAEAKPDHPAYIMAATAQVITYRELDEGSNRLAHLLRKAGLERGDHIAFMIENHPLFLQIAWAAQRSGLYYTAISSRVSADGASYIINDCGARAFITSAAMGDVPAELVDVMPQVELRLILDTQIDGYENYQDAVAACPATKIDDEAEGLDMLYSSGTTGRPKGVLHPLPEEPIPMQSGVQVLGELLLGYRPEMVYLNTAPLYHAAPLRFSMGALRTGGTVIVLEKFDPVGALKAIETYRVTHSQWVPTMFIKMLKLDEEQRLAHDLASHEMAIHAAAPCPVAVKQQLMDWWGPIVHEYYAGTEGNGFVYCTPEQWLARPGTVGQAIQGELHVCNDEGREVAVGEAGTVYFGQANFEYHNDPDKTSDSRHPGNAEWSTLGDIGHVDDAGYLYLTDRKAFMIISGGVNIYPQEAENVLIMHESVADVAVFGVPHEEFGEEVKAIVQPAAGVTADRALEATLLDYVGGQLGQLKSPRSIDFRDELPRHPTGKLYKRLLRDEYWKDHGSSI